jgi:hypothetical protein
MIISDGVQSYYIFSYGCGEIQWSGVGDETAIVGFNLRADFFYNHPANGLPDIDRIVSCGVQPDDMSSRRVVDGEIPATLSQQSCGQVANADDRFIPDITALEDMDGNDITSKLPLCPLTLDLFQFNSHIFEPFPSQPGNCYRSNSDNTFIPTDSKLQGTYEFVSVCCYADNG